MRIENIEIWAPRIHQIAIAATVRELSRYNIRPGRIFGKPGAVDKYRILELAADRVLYKKVDAARVFQSKIDDLVIDWNKQGFKEISTLDEILLFLKKYLTPLVGAMLVTALVNWLREKV